MSIEAYWIRLVGLLSVVAVMGCGADEAVNNLSDINAGSSNSGPIIRNLAIVPNPNNDLSCFVSWTTNVPATSAVEFGQSGEYEHRIGDEELVLDHEVFVMGMHADAEYLLKAVSLTPGSTQESSKEVSFTTGALPESVPEGTVAVYDADLAYTGWTLANVYSKDRRFPATAVMYDMSGRAVWCCIPRPEEKANPGLDLSLVDGDHVLFGAARTNDPPVEMSLACEAVWNGPEQPSGNDGQLHHHFEKLPNGNYLTLKKDVRQIDEENVIGDIVIEMNSQYDIVWSWNVWDHLEPGTGDWTHGNSATVDLDEGVAYYNSRHLSMFFKIRRSSGMLGGEIIWSLGEGGDFSADPDAVYPWFERAHDPEVQANGDILIYDNGNRFRGSRVVEYSLDTETMEARIVWEFPGAFETDEWYKDNWYTPYWGDADRLENGNILINAGTDIIGYESRIFEVTPDGIVVWEFVFPSDDEAVFGSYRAERVIPPLIEDI
jgi:hypothetical protein